MGYHSGAEEGVFMARRRHLDALEQATSALERAAYQLEVVHAGELVAEELREAQTLWEKSPGNSPARI